MKYEYLKGSEKDFEGAPEWAMFLSKDEFGDLAWDEGETNAPGLRYQWVDPENGCGVQKYTEGAIGVNLSGVIAERRPITEPELKPIYGDGIHDDTEALQQRIDMGIDIKPILNNGVFLTLKPLQFKPITEPVWLVGELPPAGTQVDIISDVGDSIVFEGSLTGEVIAHVEDYAIVRMHLGLACFKADRLLPSRSPEDVARDEAIDSIQANLLLRREVAIDFYEDIAAGRIKGITKIPTVGELMRVTASATREDCEAIVKLLSGK